MSVRVHYFQHVSFEGLSALEPLLKSRKHHVTCTRFFLGESAPPSNEIDWLIILGGPMGACDDHAHGWMSGSSVEATDAIS